MTKIQMKRSEALEWIKLGIERERYDVVLRILEDLIEQERKAEECVQSVEDEKLGNSSHER